MKRTELIEWGIVVIALIFGYKFLESIISLIIQVIYSFDSGLRTMDMLRIILVIGLYAVFFIVLIKSSHTIAAYLSPVSSAGDLTVKIGKRSMLQVILITICALTILIDIPNILFYIFESFKTDVQRNRYLEDNRSLIPGKFMFVVKILQVIVAVLVIYLSKSIAELLVRKNEADELVFDSTTEK